MGLEAATYINQLNAAWPVGGTDPVAQGDDHIRMIKSALQATFPNITGAVTATHTQLNTAGSSGVTGLANPTAVIGLAAINGALLTAMRSDGAPALSQNIAPVWTGVHSFTLPTIFANGSSANPGVQFSDGDTGIFLQGADDMRFSAGGVTRFIVRTDGVYSRLVNWGVLGAAAAPTYSFEAEPTNGMYRSSANAIGFATAGVGRVTIEANGQMLVGVGVVGVPTIAFAGDLTTGLYQNGAGNVAITTAGVNRFNVAAAGITSTAIHLNPDGLVGAPSYSFFSDPDTGFYRISANNIGVAAAGALVASFVPAVSGSVRLMDYAGNIQIAGYRNIPQNSQSANYTAVLDDSGKHIFHPSGGGAGDVFTIPANSTVAFDIGTAITFINSDSNNITIAITTDVLTLAGTTTTGSRTLAQNGVATAIKVTATSWIISGTGLS